MFVDLKYQRKFFVEIYNLHTYWKTEVMPYIICWFKHDLENDIFCLYLRRYI